MAIKISGTTVIGDLKSLENIDSVDSTSATSIKTALDLTPRSLPETPTSNGLEDSSLVYTLDSSSQYPTVGPTEYTTMGTGGTSTHIVNSVTIIDSSYNGGGDRYISLDLTEVVRRAWDYHANDLMASSWTMPSNSWQYNGISKCVNVFYHLKYIKAGGAMHVSYLDVSLNGILSGWIDSNGAPQNGWGSSQIIPATTDVPTYSLPAVGFSRDYVFLIQIYQPGPNPPQYAGSEISIQTFAGPVVETISGSV